MGTVQKRWQFDFLLCHLFYSEHKILFISLPVVSNENLFGFVVYFYLLLYIFHSCCDDRPTGDTIVQKNGGVTRVRDTSCHTTKDGRWRQNVTEHAREHYHSVLNRQKQCETSSPATMFQLSNSQSTTYASCWVFSLLENPKVNLPKDGAVI